METQGKLRFPRKKSVGTTWKSQVSNKFPQDRKLMRSSFSDPPAWKLKETLMLPTGQWEILNFETVSAYHLGKPGFKYEL